MGEAIDVAGHCYCGAIQYRVRIPAGEAPIFSVYCHCDSCRRSHAAPLYHVVGLDADHIEITEGEEHLKEFRKSSESPSRCFCDQCGSRILNRFGDWRPGGKTPLAIFPPTLEAKVQRNLPEVFRPRRHNVPEETVLDRESLEAFFHDM